MAELQSGVSDAGPSISVIIPAYNAQGTILRCVESVLEQTQDNIEIIIVNDGSVDGTPAICDGMARQYSNIRVVHQENSGLSAARNSGIRESQAPYLFFLDSDDYISKFELESLFKVKDSTCALMVVGGLTRISQNGERIGQTCLASCVVDECGYWTKFEEALILGDYSELIISCGKLIHRSLFEGNLFDSGKIHEDEFIIHRLVSRARSIAFAETTGYFYVQHADSIVHNPSAQSLLDAAEGLLARTCHFVEHAFWNFALTSLCIARGELVDASICCLSNNDRERLAELRQQWIDSCCLILPKQRRSIKSVAGCILFAVFPRFYTQLRSIKRGASHD